MLYPRALALLSAAALFAACDMEPQTRPGTKPETTAVPTVPKTTSPTPSASTVVPAPDVPATAPSVSVSSAATAETTAAPMPEIKEVSPIRILDPEGVDFVYQKTWQMAEPNWDLLNRMKHAENAPVLDVVVMHTAVPTTADNELDVLRNIQLAHINRGWGDISAHYLIGPSGKVYQGRKIWYRLPDGTSVGEGMGRFNFPWSKCSIMLMGDFNSPSQEFTPEAKTALTTLIEDRQHKFGEIYRDALEARQAETRALLGPRGKDTPLDHDQVRLIYSPSLPGSVRSFLDNPGNEPTTLKGE